MIVRTFNLSVSVFGGLPRGRFFSEGLSVLPSIAVGGFEAGPVPSSASPIGGVRPTPEDLRDAADFRGG